MQNIITRFAPSPTGYLHIGGVRTALFNWLFAKANNGKFILRIEDTDQKRSTQESVDKIIDSMKWLGLDYDQISYQSKCIQTHQEFATKLLELGHAYKCYIGADEIAEFKAQNPHKKFQSPYRDKAKQGVKSPFVIRIKAPQNNVIAINDIIQGDVNVQLSEIDDFILMRQDMSPTYIFASAIDDITANITHIIRGDDHFTNSFRQKLIYDALGHACPSFAHIPLIHGADGAKLSKRHNVTGAHEYRDLGYLPSAMISYLARLGWSPGHDDILNTTQIVEQFSLNQVGKSPAQFDLSKLNHINAYFLSNTSPEQLFEYIEQMLPKHNQAHKERIISGMTELSKRSQTLLELAKISSLYIQRSNAPDEKSQSIIASYGHLDLRPHLVEFLKSSAWDRESIKNSCAQFARVHDTKLGVIMQLLRTFIFGDFHSPPIPEALEILGEEEVITRLSQDYE